MGVRFGRCFGGRRKGFLDKLMTTFGDLSR